MSSPSSPVRARVGTGWGLDTRKCECPTHWGLSLLESPIKAPPGGGKEEAKVITEEAKKKLKNANAPPPGGSQGVESPNNAPPSPIQGVVGLDIDRCIIHLLFFMNLHLGQIEFIARPNPSL